MYSRLKGQNLYRTKLAADMTPITQLPGDDPTTEFSFTVETEPAVSKGYIYVDFTKDAKRDLIYFHRKSTTTLYYYRGNRDLESNGVYGITHTKGSYLQLNDVDRWIDRTFDTTDDLGYIDIISNKKIKIFGGIAYYNGIQKTIADTSFQTLADGTRYAVLDYADDTLKFVAAVDYDTHLWFATVVMASGVVSSITNQKGEQLHANKTTIDLFTKNGTWVRYNGIDVGNVTGPSSSTNNNITTMDGTTGKKVKDSGKSFDTDSTMAANSDNRIPTQKAVKTAISTIPVGPAGPTGPAGQGMVTVDIIFDDSLNDLPSDTSTQIDGHTIVTGDLVYVKNCSDAGKIGNIYEATVVGTTITWVFSSTPVPGSIIYVTYGTVYGGTTNIIGGTLNVNNINITNLGLSAILTTGDADDYLYARSGYSAYVNRDIFFLQAHITNNDDPTININSLGAKDIVDKFGVGIKAGCLDVDTSYFLMYNSSLDKMVLLYSSPFIKVGTTAAMSGNSLDHVDTDSTDISIVNRTASAEPNGFIEVDVGTPGHIIFTSTVAETCSFTYSLIK